MIIIDCEQGSTEWFDARLGKPTASNAAKIVTPKGKPTANAGRRTYALELVAERITRRVAEHYVSPAMERGKNLERVARMWYHLATGATVREVGFCVDDSGAWGASPDGLVDAQGGGLEIKCPGLPHYLDILSTGIIDDSWLMQCQMTMAVTGCAWWDFVLYTDVQPFTGWIKRIERDDGLCAKILEAVQGFCAELDETEQAIRERIGR